MARLPYVDPSDAPEPVRTALEGLPPLNIFRMIANADTALRPFLRYGNTLLAHLALDPLLRELAILQVSRLTPHAEYEWVQHVPIAKAVGARDEQIAALERDEPDADCFDSDPARDPALHHRGGARRARLGRDVRGTRRAACPRARSSSCCW